MKKIIGIASLIIALILGTCLSSQAQIVMVQPMQIDGGFNSYMNLLNKGKQNLFHEGDVSENNNSSADLDHNKYHLCDAKTDYESLYKVCTYKENEETGLHSGIYYRKLVSCDRKSNKTLDKLN